MSVQDEISAVINDALAVVRNPLSSYGDLCYYQGFLNGLLLTAKNEQLVKKLQEALDLVDTKLEGDVFW